LPKKTNKFFGIKEKRMKKKLVSIILVVAFAAVLLAACSVSDTATGESDASPAASETASAVEEEASASADQAAKTVINIGTTANALDCVDSGKASLEAMGYEVNVVMFDDYVTPNVALTEGSIDVNLFQHQPYLDAYNTSNETDIIMVQKLWEYYAGLYSVKADSIEDLPDGGKVGTSEDAANKSLDLQNIASTGLITLTDEAPEDSLYTELDIVDNPHGYEFIASDSNRWNNMDEYTFVTGTSNSMATNGIDPTQNQIAYFPMTDEALGLCILPENQDQPWVADMIAAYTSEEAQNYIDPSSGFVFSTQAGE
jgi:D-methionine transport system substrate-binding protein